MCADPFLNDQNFVLSVLTLEELGATGNKVSPYQTPCLPHLSGCPTAKLAYMNSRHMVRLGME